MTTVSLYSQSIQNLLEAVQTYEGSDIWSDVLNHCTTKHDRELTSTFCSSDCADFIAMDGNDAFLFDYNEQTDKWSVSHVGNPVYHVEREMIGDFDSADFDYDKFLAVLRDTLEGVEVVNGSALHNVRSSFVEAFKRNFDLAFDMALDAARGQE